jgi:V8-like Glu-specific endopeptidase
LNGPQLGKIRDAIVDAYGGSSNALADLNAALTDNFEDRNVYNYVIVHQQFPLQVADLLVKANNQGWIPSLLGALQQHRPEATVLQDVIRSVLATVPARQALDFAAGGSGISAQVRAELQDILPGGAIVDLPTMQRRVRCVCRIDYADQSPPGVGTGFLVGPDLVLTNSHVVRRVQEVQPSQRASVEKQLRFRFDLLERADAVDALGRSTTAMLNGGSAILRTSPTGGMERVGGRGEPGMDELDYALIRVSERVGDDPIEKGERRGYMRLKTSASLHNGAIMVLQHPMRGELQFALGNVLGTNSSGSRVKHTAATQKGSSGSPVLDAMLGLVALHNGTRRGTEYEKQSYNTAVPLVHIVADLRSAGITEMLQE